MIVVLVLVLVFSNTISITYFLTCVRTLLFPDLFLMCFRICVVQTLFCCFVYLLFSDVCSYICSNLVFSDLFSDSLSHV
jgi:hypothetical protein